jgi:hypothetical protein
MADIYLGKGDLLPVLTATLQNSDGTPIDLTGATVALVIKNVLDVETVREADIVSATLGNVRYEWVAGDTATAGDFRCRWRITDGADITTVPNDGELTMIVS